MPLFGMRRLVVASVLRWRDSKGALGRKTVEEFDDPEGDRGDEGGGGDRKDPGPDDPAGDAPLYGGQPSRGAYADDRPGDCVSG